MPLSTVNCTTPPRNEVVDSWILDINCITCFPVSAPNKDLFVNESVYCKAYLEGVSWLISRAEFEYNNYSAENTIVDGKWEHINRRDILDFRAWEKKKKYVPLYTQNISVNLHLTKLRIAFKENRMKSWATHQKNDNSTLWMWENASTETSVWKQTLHIAFRMAQCVTGPEDQESGIQQSTYHSDWETRVEKS